MPNTRRSRSAHGKRWRVGSPEAPASASRRLAWRSSQTSALAPTARGGRGHGWPCRRKASQGCSPRITSSGPPSPPSHDTSRIAWAKLMARWGRSFLLRARGVVATSDSEETAGRSRLTSNRRFASGRRPGCESPREDNPWRISANRSNHRPSRRPMARPPTGESSCRSKVLLVVGCGWFLGLRQLWA
jgi:hypothetical protein